MLKVLKKIMTAENYNFLSHTRKDSACLKFEGRVSEAASRDGVDTLLREGKCILLI